MTEKRRKPKAGAPRTEVFAMRLDPKLKYLSELAARKQRRSLSSFIEWAVQDALKRVVLVLDFNPGRANSERTVASVANDLWDVDEADRFVKLAAFYPDLLTHDEQVLWKLIQESEFYRSLLGSDLKGLPDFPQLREHWDTFKKVAAGDLPRSALPTASQTVETVQTKKGRKHGKDV